ncbi:MAG: PAN domain-containing protein [Patescibacteria group bacterium]
MNVNSKSKCDKQCGLLTSCRHFTFYNF